MFHNSVIVAGHKFTCKCLAGVSGPDLGLVAGVSNKPLESADNSCFRSRVFWSIIICVNILLNTWICFLKGGEDTSLTALCNARRWLHLPAHSDWFCWAPVHCGGHCHSPAR